LSVAAISSASARAAEQACTKTVNPGQRIQVAVKQAIPGDVICVLPGRYHETLFLGVSGTETERIIVRGEGGRPIVDGQYTLPLGNNIDPSRTHSGCPGTVEGRLPDGTKAPQRFECSGVNPLVGIFASHVTFEGFDVVNSSGVGIGAISKSGLNDVVIRNNYVRSSRSNGILLHNVTDAVVENNEISDAGNFAPFWRAPQVLYWGSGVGAFASHFVMFRANIIHDNWGDGLLVDVNTGGSTDITVDGNVLYNNYSTNGVYAHAIKNLAVTNNLIYCPTGLPIQNSTSLLIAPAEPNYPNNIDVENILVKGNVFAACATPGIIIWNTKPGVRRVKNLAVIGNLFYGEERSIAVRGPDDASLQEISLTGNLVIGGSLTLPGAILERNEVQSSAAAAGLSGVDGRGNFPTVWVAGSVERTWFASKVPRDFDVQTSSLSEPGLLSAPSRP